MVGSGGGGSERSLADAAGLIVRLGVSQRSSDGRLELADANEDVRERKGGGVIAVMIVDGAGEGAGEGGAIRDVAAGEGEDTTLDEHEGPDPGVAASDLADDAALAPDDERVCVGRDRGRASSDFARAFRVEAVERRRASRADTGRTTPSALSPSLEKRGADD